MIAELLLIFIIGYLLWDHFDPLNSRKLPPGPFRFPVIGNVVTVGLADKIPYKALDKISKKYGKNGLTRLDFGQKTVVVVDSPKQITNILAREECLSRSAVEEMKVRTMYKNAGVLISEGEVWKEMRRFMLSSLRNFGFNNRRSMEPMIHAEVRDTVEYMAELSKADPSHIVDINHGTFVVPAINVLLNIIVGARCSRNDQDCHLMKFIHMSHKFMQSLTVTSGLYNYWPGLITWMPELSGYNQTVRLTKEMVEICEDILVKSKEKRAKFGKPETNTCFVDDFLDKMEEEKGNKDTLFTDDQFKICIMDLMQAGSDTTSSVIGFAFLLLTVYPRIQEELVKEVRKVVENERMPCVQDRDKMPYYQAFITETLRWARTATIVPRNVMQEFWLDGYKFAKDTAVYVNLHSYLMNEELWEDPEVFKPERFLKEDGTFNKQEADKMLAFGVGRRSCLGEGMARDVLFLMITTLVQNFEMHLPHNQPAPCLDPILGMAATFPNFQAVVKARV